jgi:cation transport ATPase
MLVASGFSRTGLMSAQPAWVNWMGLALATPVVFWAGWPFFARAWMSVVNRSPNMFTLIALGVGSAYVYSALGTVVPGIFPAGFRMQVVETYFDTAVVITVLVLMGQVLELRARRGTSAAIRQLPPHPTRLAWSATARTLSSSASRSAISAACVRANACRWTESCSKAWCDRRIDAPENRCGRKSPAPA